MANNTVVHSVEFTGDASKLQAACAQAAQAVSSLGNSMSANNANINSVSTSLSNMTTKVSSLFAGIGIALSATSFINFAKSAVQTSASLEQLSISFEVFTGSIEVADIMLAKLKDQALNSPMQFQDITKGAQILMQYGLTAEQVIPISKMLGDVSGGNADKFNRLALAFGQVNAAGRLMGQEARQMINAGFNPLQAISEKTGESMASLSKRMHDGQISVQEVGNAFTYATSEGGRFFGMADKQSQTLQGQFNKLEESITFAMAELGTAISDNLQLGDTISYISEQVNQLTDSLKNLNSEGTNTSPILSLINLLAKATIVSIDSLKNSVIFLKDSFNLFISENSGVILFFKNVLSGIEIVAEKIPVLGKYVNELSDYWTNFYDKGSKELPISIQIENLKNDIFELQKNPNINLKFGLVNSKQVSDKILELQRDLSELIFKGSSKDLNLNNMPAGAEASSMSKTEKAKYDKLAEQARLGYTNINNQVRLFSESKLEMFDRYAKEELDKLKQAGLDTTRVQQSQFDARKKLVQQETAKLSALIVNNTTPEGLKNSLARMVEEQTKSIKKIFKSIDESIAENKIDAKDFIPTLDSTEFEFAVNEFVNNDNINKIKNYSNAMGSALQDFGVNIFAGFANIAGSALAGINTFGDAIAQVGSMFLNLVGDLLIQMGTSAIKLGISAEAIEKVLKAIGLPGGGIAAIAAGTLAVAAGSILKGMATKTDGAITAKSSGGQVSVKSGGSSGMTTGSAYSYGGSSYSAQTIRLAIDLTGSITSTQTGYQINKSLETVLRVTGR
jgi:tape measure domain-containing protein